MSDSNRRDSISEVDEEEMAGGGKYREEGDHPEVQLQYDDDSNDEVRVVH